jgi:hypothetical protein
MLEARGDLAGGDGAADPLESDPTTAANVGASLAAVRLRGIVGRPGASHACDHGQGRYEDGEHAHECPSAMVADTVRTFIGHTEIVTFCL